MKLGFLLAMSSLVITCSMAGSARAQNPPERNGFFLGFNVGGGSAKISSDPNREGGSDFNLRLGGAIKDDLLIGLEISSWLKDQSGTTVFFDAYTAALTYYPGNQGFFVRGGVGVGSVTVQSDLGGGVSVSKNENGFGAMAAAGYEWRLTKKFALGPQAEYVYLNIGGDLVDTANFFDATLGFNWYW
ncbi:MAG TPA: outer membrane beta-barrel protein [Candidatus Krumholzibacteria bacterium]|nr:outer membrane beta-barrel protein [Candidatus Krumholzibacteria bacterium]